MWVLWQGKGIPFSVSEERVFVSELQDLVASSSAPARRGDVPAQVSYGFDRDDATILMTLLRCGADLGSAVAAAPGLTVRARPILAAYTLLSRERDLADRSWQRMLSGSRPSALRAASRASLLIPLPVQELRRAPVASFAHVRSDVALRVAAAGRAALAIRSEVAGSADPELLAAASSRLFHPHSGGLFRSPWFLPGHVSELSPEGVALLLPADIPQGRV